MILVHLVHICKKILVFVTYVLKEACWWISSARFAFCAMTLNVVDVLVCPGECLDDQSWHSEVADTCGWALYSKANICCRTFDRAWNMFQWNGSTTHIAAWLRYWANRREWDIERIGENELLNESARMSYWSNQREWVIERIGVNELLSESARMGYWTNRRERVIERIVEYELCAHVRGGRIVRHYGSLINRSTHEVDWASNVEHATANVHSEWLQRNVEWELHTNLVAAPTEEGPLYQYQARPPWSWPSVLYASTGEAMSLRVYGETKSVTKSFKCP